MKGCFIFAILTYISLGLVGNVGAATPDKHESCEFWAESGECDQVCRMEGLIEHVRLD